MYRVGSPSGGSCLGALRLGIPFVVVASGGLPVVNTSGGIAMSLATNGDGIPVTIATNGFGIAANLVGYNPGGSYVPTYYILGF